uniref:Uncharacterized protein n=2 Tax=Chrysotila carterae TaxID=13221 RepID=A0A7S4B3D4_CHRCT
MRRTPFVLAGGVRRSCGARGYGGAVTQPHAVDTYLSNEESIEAVHSGAEENEARNSDVIVLTSFAATTWEMNRMFLLDFDQLYRAMMISTHGNGCDLIYTDYLRRNGGIVHDLPRNATKFGFVSQESQQEGGYKDKPEHYVARSKICRCLANKDTSPGCAHNRLPS